MNEDVELIEITTIGIHVDSYTSAVNTVPLVKGDLLFAVIRVDSDIYHGIFDGKIVQLNMWYCISREIVSEICDSST